MDIKINKWQLLNFYIFAYNILLNRFESLSAWWTLLVLTIRERTMGSLDPNIQSLCTFRQWIPLIPKINIWTSQWEQDSYSSILRCFSTLAKELTLVTTCWRQPKLNYRPNSLTWGRRFRFRSAIFLNCLKIKNLIWSLSGRLCTGFPFGKRCRR